MHYYVTSVRTTNVMHIKAKHLVTDIALHCMVLTPDLSATHCQSIQKVVTTAVNLLLVILLSK